MPSNHLASLFRLLDTTAIPVRDHPSSTEPIPNLIRVCLRQNAAKFCFGNSQAIEKEWLLR
jgi:hypothetical protein